MRTGERIGRIGATGNARTWVEERLSGTETFALTCGYVVEHSAWR